MNKLELTADLLKLPVTDIRHVIHEINIDREVQDTIQRCRKRAIWYNQKYKERKKHEKL